MDTSRELVDQLLAIALDEALAAKADGAQPVGAVIANDVGEVVARGRNRVLVTGDLTAHAEIDTIRQGGFRLHNRDEESEWSMYVTAESCFMCLGGILMCPIDRIVWALKSPLGSPFAIVKESPYWDPSRVERLTALMEPNEDIRNESRRLLIEYFLVHNPLRARLLEEGREQ